MNNQEAEMKGKRGGEEESRRVQKSYLTSIGIQRTPCLFDRSHLNASEHFPEDTPGD